MRAFRQFLFVEAAAFVSLLVAAAVLAGGSAANAGDDPHALVGPGAAAWITFAYTMVIGVLPALVFGAPAYYVLLRAGFARWYAVLFIGIVPGLGMLALDADLGSWAIACGAVVALMTHVAWLQISRWATASDDRSRAS